MESKGGVVTFSNLFLRRRDIQAFADCRNTHAHICSLSWMQYSDFRDSRRLLRARGERPYGRRATEQRYELAALHHSITSSASASNLSGALSYRAFAVLRLITSSNFVGACTGRSPG